MPALATALLVVLAGRQEPNREAPNRARIHAQFVDGNGLGIAGASVLNRVWPGAGFPVVTDANGRMEATVEWPADHRDTWYDCRVRAFGFARWTLDDQLVPGQELDLGTVRLALGGSVSGLLWLGSAGVERGQVEVVKAEDLPAGPVKRADEIPWKKVVDRGSCTSDGAFRVVGLPPGRFGLWARCDSSWWMSAGAFEVRAGEDTRLPDLRLQELPPDHRIEGVVLDTDGAPVADVSITGTPSHEAIPTGHDHFIPQLDLCRAGPDGRFRLYLNPYFGAFDLTAKVDGERFVEASLPSVAAGTRDVVLRFGRLHEILLRVRDSAGRPIEHFGVLRHIALPSGGGSDLGDADRHHPEGTARLRITETASTTFTIEATGYEDKELEFGSTDRELTIVLEANPVAASLEAHGRVLCGGRPIPGAHVELVQRDIDLVDDLVGRSWIGVHHALSGDCVAADDQGRFRLASDFPHIQYFVRAWADGVGTGVVGPVLLGGFEVDVPLTSGGVLAGRVRLPREAPVSGLPLVVYQVEGDSLECRVGREFRALTDASGSYVFEHLPAGPWLVSIALGPGQLQQLGREADGKALRKTPFVFALGEGRLTNGDIDLSEPRGSCRLRGRLTVGDKIREGYAYLQLGGEQVLRIAFGGLDSDGRFEVTTHAPGTYRLVINAGPGEGSYRLVTDLVTLAPGETTWERSLTPADWKQEGVRLDHE